MNALMAALYASEPGTCRSGGELSQCTVTPRLRTVGLRVKGHVLQLYPHTAEVAASSALQVRPHREELRIVSIVFVATGKPTCGCSAACEHVRVRPLETQAAERRIRMCAPSALFTCSHNHRTRNTAGSTNERKTVVALLCATVSSSIHQATIRHA